MDQSVFVLSFSVHAAIMVPSPIMSIQIKYYQRIKYLLLTATLRNFVLQLEFASIRSVPVLAPVLVAFRGILWFHCREA